MQILEILTKQVTSQEIKRFIMLIIMSVLWLYMIITVLKTDKTHVANEIVSVAIAQYLVMMAYTESRVASVKKELLKEQEEIKFTLKALEQAKQQNLCQK
jgi:hypothetical protein